VDQVMVQCLTNTLTALIECPTNYKLQLGSTVIYVSAGVCPSTPVPDDCLHSNVTNLVTTSCSSDSSCLLTIPPPTALPVCNWDGLSTPSVPGEYYAVIGYRCDAGSVTYYLICKR